MGKNGQLVFRRAPGNNLPKLICDLAASGIIPALEELVANSHDADAQNVSVTYEPKTSTLTIQDDGLGMDAKDLEGFYRLGDSYKQQRPVTPKGRRCIGKYGIATILLEYLADSYDLETIKKGRRTVIHEEFDGTLTSEKKIKGVPSKAPKALMERKSFYRISNSKKVMARSCSRTSSTACSGTCQYCLTSKSPSTAPRSHPSA